MQIANYIFFNGNCEEAFKFYELALGGKIEAMLTHKGTPAEGQVPPEWQDKILHARLTVEGQTLMASDAPPGRYSKPQGFSIALSTDDPARAQRFFDALADQGNTIMPFQKTFWAEGFGMCTDRFGIPWMVSCEQAQASAAH